TGPAQRESRIGGAAMLVPELLAGYLDGRFEEVPTFSRATLRHQGQAEPALGVQVPGQLRRVAGIELARCLAQQLLGLRRFALGLQRATEVDGHGEPAP